MLLFNNIDLYRDFGAGVLSAWGPLPFYDPISPHPLNTVDVYFRPIRSQSSYFILIGSFLPLCRLFHPMRTVVTHLSMSELQPACCLPSPEYMLSRL
jgi:hypothetical protein